MKEEKFFTCTTLCTTFVVLLVVSTKCGLGASTVKDEAGAVNDLKRAPKTVGVRATTEAEVKEYMENYYESEASKLCNLASVADFNYQTDLTNGTKEEEVTTTALDYAKWEKNVYDTEIKNWSYSSFVDESLKRQIKFVSAIGTSALDVADLTQYNNILSEMAKIYGTAKVCPFDNQDCDIETHGLNLEPELTKILAESRNYSELAYVWEKWRDASGMKMRDLYLNYVELSNKAATLNDYDNMGDFWLLRYESDTFREEIHQVFEEVKEALYKPLYNFVRARLTKVYPNINPVKMIPANVLGNMWSQTWENILDVVLPYPGAIAFDISTALQEKLSNTTLYPDELSKRVEMFEIANKFFMDLGLESMSVAYNEKAMIMKPDDKSVICHASAWDMCDGQDYRIKMCTEINHNDFITIHHELGHIQYYLEYQDKPITFRGGANPGFHEAIGDVIALSVSTPEHLKGLGFDLGNITEDSRVNFLMQMALDKIAFLPFGYMIDNYRWQIFNGQIPSTNLTYNWLKMRAEFQGVVPPVVRDEMDFDAGAKYHVPANTPYIRYFVSYILQFQIHQKLCEVAGQYPGKPLSECDINGNSAAGAYFGEILKSGASENWQDLLERVTGNRTLSAYPIIEYFKKLTDFLNERAEAENYPTGWDPSEFESFFMEIVPEEDDGTNIAAMVVGIVLGVVVLVIVVGYFFGKKLRK